MRHNAILLGCVFASVSGLHATAQVLNGSTVNLLPQVQLSQAEEHQFPQEKLGNCNADAPSTQSFGHATMKVDADGKVFIEGLDLQGRGWSASIETAPVATCEIWQADLNADGQDDLVVIAFGANSSGGWDTNLSLLIFGKDGRPFPWQATGNFHVSAAGIKEIISMNGAATASIVVPQREGEQGAVYGYAYTAYRVAGDRLARITSNLWPLFAAPTQSLRAHQAANDLSTNGKLDSSKSLPRVESLVGNNDDERRLKLSDRELLKEPRLLVIHMSSGTRSIQFSPQASDLQGVVQQNAAAVSLGTSCEQAECQPLLLWTKL